MTTHRTYICNLCGDSLKPSASTAKDGFGIHFAPSGGATFKRTSEAENHICLQCAVSVRDELLKVTPAQADKEQQP